ncbi:hypothetical protein TNCV_4905641 [Trichonephila clavipes]|uniref:Uncharacterized protein n=1 Tax=Trichonephila clavipes TaxID=2585209 RepID=A0A8X6RN36_TRICX|nr:hypothetical protein TNCV_4905641 [Trichonephila clavipes]
MIKFIDFCEVQFLPESVTRVADISGDHCCPYASALIQRDFGCVLRVQQTNQLPHDAKVDLVLQPAREAIKSSDRRRTFGQSVPHVVAHYPVKICLWPSAEGKEGQLAPTSRRCSTGSLKGRQCVLEKCQSGIQYCHIP